MKQNKTKLKAILAPVVSVSLLTSVGCATALPIMMQTKNDAIPDINVSIAEYQMHSDIVDGANGDWNSIDTLNCDDTDWNPLQFEKRNYRNTFIKFGHSEIGNPETAAWLKLAISCEMTKKQKLKIDLHSYVHIHRSDSISLSGTDDFANVETYNFGDSKIGKPNHFILGDLTTDPDSRVKDSNTIKTEHNETLEQYNGKHVNHSHTTGGFSWEDLDSKWNDDFTFEFTAKKDGYQTFYLGFFYGQAGEGSSIADASLNIELLFKPTLL